MPRFSSKFSFFGRIGSLLSATALAICTTLPAAAKDVDDLGAYRSTDEPLSTETDRSFALELRFGPYLPRVDSEFDGGAHPFRDYFGTKHRFMAGLEFDWLPLSMRDVFRLGLGGGFSYTSMSAPAQTTDGGGDSAQDTRLRLMPHWLVGVAKLDILARRTIVPITFTAKLGLANALWWVKDDPSANRAGAVKGKGQTYGLYYGVGASLDLGFLDRYRTRRLDATMGINSVYLFGEAYGMELESFGKRNAMHVGDRSWVLGLGLDF